MALLTLGKKEDALGCFTKALELKPSYQVAWFYKGLILKGLGKYKEALMYFTEAIELNSKVEMTWYNKGVILGRLGKFEKASDCYHKAKILRESKNLDRNCNEAK